MCLLLNVEVILSLATVLVVLQVLGTNIQYTKTFGRVWMQDEIIPRNTQNILALSSGNHVRAH